MANGRSSRKFSSFSSLYIAAFELAEKITIKAMYVQRNIEARSCNHCCSGKANKYCIFCMCVCVCVCVCSLNCPACNAHAPYCHLRSVRLYNIFPHYLTNGTIFEKKVIEHKSVIRLSLQLETFLILRRTERHMIKKC